MATRRFAPHDRGSPLPPDKLLKAACRLMQPMVQLLLRTGITFPVFADSLRALFVDIAIKDLLSDPKAHTDSRISLITGVHRKEIRRLRKGDGAARTSARLLPVGSQIIARWLAAPEYRDEAGFPRPLSRSAAPDGRASFDQLIASVTTDIRPRAVLDDWLSQGLVGLDGDDRVHLDTAAFTPKPDGEEQLSDFARNLHDHLAAAVANIGVPQRPEFFDRNLQCDHLTAEAAQRLEVLACAAGTRALIEFSRLVEELGDGPDQTEPRRATWRVNFGIYIYTDHDPGSAALE